MIKYWMTVIAMGMVCIVAAQSQETQRDDAGMLDASLQKRVFKVAQPTADRSDIYEVTSLGQTTHTASNTSDGSVASFRHSMRIELSLVTPAYKGGTCQLVFYGSDDKIQQAASTDNGVVSIYYPLAVYESLRTRLEQAIAGRKKVQIKVTQKTNGYREGVLIF